MPPAWCCERQRTVGQMGALADYRGGRAALRTRGRGLPGRAAAARAGRAAGPRLGRAAARFARRTPAVAASSSRRPGHGTDAQGRGQRTEFKDRGVKPGGARGHRAPAGCRPCRRALRRAHPRRHRRGLDCRVVRHRVAGCAVRAVPRRHGRGRRVPRATPGHRRGQGGGARDSRRSSARSRNCASASRPSAPRWPRSPTRPPVRADDRPRDRRHRGLTAEMHRQEKGIVALEAQLREPARTSPGPAARRISWPPRLDARARRSAGSTRGKPRPASPWCGSMSTSAPPTRRCRRAAAAVVGARTGRSGQSGRRRGAGRARRSGRALRRRRRGSDADGGGGRRARDGGSRPAPGHRA